MDVVVELPGWGDEFGGELLDTTMESGSPFGLAEVCVGVGFRLDDIFRRASIRFLFCRPYFSLTISFSLGAVVVILGVG